MQKNRQRDRSYHNVKKVIACVLSLVFFIIAIAVPAHAEEEQAEATPSRISLSDLEETIDAYVASYEKYTAAVRLWRSKTVKLL